MKLTTPVNGLKNGELYTIRDSYAKMLNESAEKSFKDGLFTKIYESVKASDYEKLTTFAKKNHKLCNFATDAAIKNACKGIECDENVLKEACAKVKCAIDADLDVFKKNCKEISADAKCAEKVREEQNEPINEAGDYDDNEDDEPDDGEPVYHDSDDVEDNPKTVRRNQDNLTKDELREIDRLTKDIDYDRSIDKDDDDQDTSTKADDAEDSDSDDAEGAKGGLEMGDGKDSRTFKKASDEFDTDSDRETAYDQDDDDITFNKVGKGYCVKRIVAGIFIDGKIIGRSVMLYSDPYVQDGDYTNAVVGMDDVIDFVNKKVGIYFSESDYSIDFSVVNGDAVNVGGVEFHDSPKLLAGKTITSDLIDGNEALASMFGPKGRYADYLYNVDGTPKFKPDSKDADGMTDAEKDVSVVSSYPVLYISSLVCKVSKTSSTPKDLTPDDVKGTGIAVKA